MKTYKGRPTELCEREEREIRVYDYLDSLGIEYEGCDHAPALTMEDCEKVDEAMGVRMCKNLFLCNRQKTSFYLLLMPGDKPFKTKELSGQLGVARLSFASSEDMERLLDIRPGAVSVMGLMNDRECEVTLLVDEELFESELFGAHPCVNTSSLKFKRSDIFERFVPATKHTITKVKLSREEQL